MQQHWLVRPGTIRRLWIGFAVVLGLTIAAEPFIDRHPHFTVDGLLSFNAIYGFLACVGLILVAKLIGLALKRPDDYYSSDGDD